MDNAIKEQIDSTIRHCKGAAILVFETSQVFETATRIILTERGGTYAPSAAGVIENTRSGVKEGRFGYPMAIYIEHGQWYGYDPLCACRKQAVPRIIIRGDDNISLNFSPKINDLEAILGW